jgi:UDP-N-acetylmuramoyl-L-alanyl-D-glutamate--2,6-diaminopimelate ligase
MIKIERSLRSLLINLQGVDSKGFENLVTDLQINGLTLDSRAVKAGMLFVALKGTQTHGLHYALNAQQQGATAILWESDTVPNQIQLLDALHIPVIEIIDLSAKLGEIAQRYYQIIDSPRPIQSNYGLKIKGVTGTDGKTTVTHFFAQAMNILMPNKSAIIGTLGIGFTDRLQQTTHTTPDVLTLHKTLCQLAKKGVKIVAMEVSSHALDQGRVDGLDFTVAILTNLTRDHLDYHGTLEQYATAKEKLFLRPELCCAVLNTEDDFSQQIENSLMEKGRERSIIRYSIKSTTDTKIETELTAEDTQFTHRGIQARLSFGNQQGILNVAVLGRFNLSNLLATLAAMLALDIPFSNALSALNKVKTVPGRMEKIDAGDKLVVVDYAHTPAALESVLKALCSHTTQRIICVFGCGGDRDKGKRPLMAHIAEHYADKVIVTDDNPRTEDPKQIMQDIIAGFEQRDNIIIEHRRANAIRAAIGDAKAGDVVLIAGKGHEQVQIFADVSEDFDDRQQAAQALQELDV